MSLIEENAVSGFVINRLSSWGPHPLKVSPLLLNLQIFHYTGGVPYLDNKGPFRDRLEFVGNPERRDGSILIKNLDFSDNGTFTCDAKNPPDIVGRPSSVRLLVFEKGEVGVGGSESCGRGGVGL